MGENIARQNAIRLLEEAAGVRQVNGAAHTRRVEEAKVWADIYRADVLARDVPETFPACTVCGERNVEDAGAHADEKGHWPA